MITVLVVGSDRPALDVLTDPPPSIEILHARDLDEALEKLARNRRVDAVLLLGGDEPSRIAEAIFEEIPAAPPLYLLGTGPAPPGVKVLEPSEPGKLLEAIQRELFGK